VSEPSTEVIGLHVSQLPSAIADVWPIVDEHGVVVELARAWNDAEYVRIGADGQPVDTISATHHLMSREVFKTAVLPEEWDFVAARRVSRGLKQIGNPFAVAEAFGDGREMDTLIELNAGAGQVLDTIDTCPPFTHVVELNGEFFVVERRHDAGLEPVAATPAAEAPAGAAPIATTTPAEPAADPEGIAKAEEAAPVDEVAAVAPEAATPVTPVAPAATQAMDDPSATEVAASDAGGDTDEAHVHGAEPSTVPPTLPPADADPDDVAQQVFTAAAVEASMVPEDAAIAVPDVIMEDELSALATAPAHRAPGMAPPLPAAPPPPENAVDLLQAMADPDADEPKTEERPQLDANVARRTSGLASELDEGVWEPGEPGDPVESPTELATGPAQPGGVTLLSEMPEDEDLESMRERSFAQATAFVKSATSSAQPAPIAGGTLTLAQVRTADCFAWDEFMNLYLPHVGFMAAILLQTPVPGSPAEVAFSPRTEADVRPVGWHHLAGCECPFCQA